MMSIEKTIPIAFHGGSYGTYLEWCLSTLTTHDDVVLPTRDDGSNHNFIGNHLFDMQGWCNYVESKQPKTFVRLHPKTKQNESVADNLETILSTVRKMILVYPDHSSVLLNVNNVFDKISKAWWPKPGEIAATTQSYEQRLISDKIFKNWSVPPDTPFDDIPTWIKREFLSLYLMPMWFDQTEWFYPEQWSNPRCLIVFVNDLLKDFQTSMSKIAKFLDLNLTKNIDQLVPFHEKMLEGQKNLGQDQLCDQIVVSTINNIYFDWKDMYLPLPSQSWIQWQLRNLGFEMRCHELNEFPTNSLTLKEIIYKT